MAIRHAQDFRQMNDAELAVQLANNHQELFNLRFQLATRKRKEFHRVREVRREIARILTVARERELLALYNEAQGILAEDEGAVVVQTEDGEPGAEPRRRRIFGRGRS